MPVPKEFKEVRTGLPKDAFEPGSFRTLKVGRYHRVIVGRLKGRAVTRAYAVLHPTAQHNTCLFCTLQRMLH